MTVDMTNFKYSNKICVDWIYYTMNMYIYIDANREKIYWHNEMNMFTIERERYFKLLTFLFENH